MISHLQDITQENIEGVWAKTLLRYWFGVRIGLADFETTGATNYPEQRESTAALELHRYTVTRSSLTENRILEMHATGSIPQVNTFLLSTERQGISFAQPATPAALESQLQQIWKYGVKNEFGDVIGIFSEELVPKDDKIEKITIGISNLQVPYEVNKGIVPLLHESTMQAVNILTSILADEISHGLPVKHITVEPLIDRDAGQWSEVVFTIQVGLDSIQANRAWDNILDKISEAADNQLDNEVVTSLLDKIGIHFKWVANSSV